jgi:hypothetical protein
MERNVVRAAPIVAPIGICLAAVALTFAAGAQDIDSAAAGLAVAPPVGYAAQPGAKMSPTQAAITVTKQSEPDTGCTISFEALPGFEQFTQDALNRQTDQPDWQRFYREGLGEFYDVARVDAFDHAGVRGAVVAAVSRVKPATQGWIADVPTLIFMFYTPKGLSKITCAATRSVFAARRVEFEAIARGVTLPR